jgi:hypothetical protein
MKLAVDKKQLAEAPEMWLRRAGYGLVPDPEAGQASFARRLTRDFYPRFHVYFTVATDQSGAEIVTFNLHLDQKRPGYAGQNRHNAEYDGEVVEGEMARLKNFIKPSFLV